MIKTGQEKSSVEITIENYEGHSPIVIKESLLPKNQIGQLTTSGPLNQKSKI